MGKSIHLSCGCIVSEAPDGVCLGCTYCYALESALERCFLLSKYLHPTPTQRRSDMQPRGLSPLAHCQFRGKQDPQRTCQHRRSLQHSSRGAAGQAVRGEMANALVVSAPDETFFSRTPEGQGANRVATTDLGMLQLSGLKFLMLNTAVYALLGWFLVGNEGMRALYIPFKGLYRILLPSFPTKNQPVD